MLKVVYYARSKGLVMPGPAPELVQTIITLTSKTLSAQICPNCVMESWIKKNGQHRLCHQARFQECPNQPELIRINQCFQWSIEHVSHSSFAHSLQLQWYQGTHLCICLSKLHTIGLVQPRKHTNLLSTSLNCLMSAIVC